MKQKPRTVTPALAACVETYDQLQYCGSLARHTYEQIRTSHLSESLSAEHDVRLRDVRFNALTLLDSINMAKCRLMDDIKQQVGC